MEPFVRRGNARKPLVDGEFLGAVRFPGGGRGKRSVRQRRSVMDGRFSGFGSPRRVPRQVRSGFRFLLQKELRNSDVGSLGRMVLPKKEAEAHLPVLTAREGILMSMDDMETLQVWTFKYRHTLLEQNSAQFLRFWPNNRSRMYVLENTGEFVKTHGLRLGDFIMLYKDDERQRFIIRARKAHAEEPSSPVIETRVTEIREEPKLCEDIPGPMIYSDAYLPMQDDISMGMAFDMNGDAFLADFTVEFSEEMLGGMRSLRSVPSLDSLENLSLDEF